MKQPYKWEDLTAEQKQAKFDYWNKVTTEHDKAKEEKEKRERVKFQEECRQWLKKNSGGGKRLRAMRRGG